MPDELCRIVVRWDPQKTGDNVLRCYHWRRVHDLRKAARLAGFRAWMDAGKPVFREKVRVSLIVRRGAKCDSGNLIGGCKPVFDGVFVGWEERRRGRLEAKLTGMLPDDGPEWLEIGTVTQEIGARWKGAEEVVLVISRAEGEDTR